LNKSRAEEEAKSQNENVYESTGIQEDLTNEECEHTNDRNTSTSTPTEGNMSANNGSFHDLYESTGIQEDL